MNIVTKLYLLGVLLFLLNSCSQPAKKQASEEQLTLSPLKYAHSFELQNGDDFKLLKIFSTGGEGASYESFKLVPAAKIKEPQPGVIPIPCKRIICLSSTQLTYFFVLDNIENIVAINSSRHLYHEGMNKKIEAGLVKRVGKEGHFNTELIASLNPDVIFVSPFKSGGYDALKSLGFNLVPMAAYEEETPLGRAEWIKMIAAFTNQEEKADSIFKGVANRYESLKERAAKVKKRPTIFSGKMRSGTWYVPGGDSFYAHYFKDAGAEYIFKDDRKAAYPLDFESVYFTAANCDYWRILLPDPVGYNKTSMLAEDPRYGDFKAFKENHVFACNIRQKPYYEQNAMKPDVILADYIHFLHPSLLPDHQPEFYELLK
ncbi:ABC transporter substrate-binding protein [Draconibacterium orientale]|uniref:ABC transporter substrate-binding protein n=1 Tax=Draconibacterium orientale TaxID=1168034 RepID=UPI0029C0B528|nr:ABC transporter substrate-binding protein [Draconibacterium orientale]